MNPFVLDIWTEEGSPWGVRLSASCVRPQALMKLSVLPSLEFSVIYSGRSVEATGRLEGVLLDDGWEQSVLGESKKAVQALLARQVSVPDSLLQEVVSSAREGRSVAIVSVVRHQAALLVRHVPAAEACHAWAEAEAAMIMAT